MNIGLVIIILFGISFLWALWSLWGQKHHTKETKRVQKELLKGRVLYQKESSSEPES